MGNLNIFDKGYFEYGRNFLSKTKFTTKEFLRRVKYAKQRIHDGFASCDLWDLDHFILELLEKSLTKFLSIEDKGVPTVVLFNALEKIYNEHENEFEHSFEDFRICSYKLTKSEKILYSIAETRAELEWEATLGRMIKCFHDANPNNRDEVCRVNSFGDDCCKYIEFVHEQLSEGFDLLKEWIFCLGW